MSNVTMAASVLARTPLAMRAIEIVGKVRLAFGEETGARIDQLIKPDGSIYTLVVDGVMVFVTIVGAPVPKEAFIPTDAERRDQDGLLLFDHCDHALVGSHCQTDDHAGRLKAAMAVLKVAHACTTVPGASAVYWMHSRALHGAASFRSLVETGDKGLPVILAHSVPFKGPDGQIGVAGVGFSVFIGRDIEFAPGPYALQVVLERYAGIVQYALIKGPILKDGDTCGVSETEIIRIHHKDSGVLIPGPVISFEIEKLDPVEDCSESA